MSLSSKVNYSLEALSGITVGNINITGNIFQNNNPYIASQWTSTSGNTLTYTSGNVIISNGSLVTSNLTTGNINFTGTLSQNGSPYIGSQWTGTSGTLYYGTAGSSVVGINTTAPIYTLDVNGTLEASNANGLMLFASTGNLGIGTTSPNTNLDVVGTGHITTSLTTGALYSTNQTTTNIVGTTATITNLNVPGTLTVVNITSTNLVDTNVTATTLNTTTITSANIYGSLGTINNLVSTNLTSSTLAISNTFITPRIDIGGTQPIYNNNTLGKLFITGSQNSVTDGPNILITTTQDTYPTYNFLTYGHDSSWTMYDMYFDGSFRNSGTATAFMMVKENSTLKWNYNSSGFSAGATAPVSTSICIGSGGNVGLGGQITPAYTLDVTGSARISSGLTVGNINFTGSLSQNGSPYIGSQWVGTSGNIYYGTSGSSFVGINTTNPQYTLDISGGARIVTGVTAGASTFTSVSSGDSQFSNLSAGNINFTGNLFQNGSAYIGSQWVGTSGNIYFGTSGSSVVGINTTSPSTTLDVTGTGRITTSLTTGSLFSTNQTTTNIVNTNQTTTNIVNTNQTTTNIVNTNISGATVNLSTGATTAAIRVTGLSTLATATATNVSVTTLNASTGATTAALRVTGLSTLATVTATNVSSTTLNASTGITTGTITATGVSSLQNVTATNVTVSNINVIGTSTSTNSSSGSVVLQGGLSIDEPTNATSVSNGGALTIAGGAAIAGDLIVGGSILYSNAAAASSTFAYLTLTASDWSTDVANGGLVVYGGISVQNTANATSASSGNGLTIGGGAGIGADLYVGGTGFIPSVVSTTNTTTNLVATGISASNINVSGTLTVVNITSTNLMETNITASGLRVTGTASTANIYSSLGTVSNLVGVNLSSSNLTSTTSTIPNIVHTNVSTATLQASTGITSAALLVTGLVSAANVFATTTTLPNTIHTNVSTATLQASTGITSAALLVTGLVSAANLTSTTSTLPNTVSTNVSTATLQASTGITSAALLVTGLVSAANLTSTTSTLPNTVSTNVSTATIQASTGITSAALLVTGLTSTANLTSTTSTLPNTVSTNISTATIQASTGITSAALLVTGLTSTANLTSTTSTLPNTVSTNVSTATLRASTGITSAALLVTGLISTANIFATTSTLPNMVSTNITTTSILVTSGGVIATFNSNTLGNVFTTGGNVGIGTTSPAYTLDVNGNMRIASSGTNYIGNSSGTVTIRMQGQNNGTTQIGTDSSTGFSFLQYYNDFVINRTTQGMTTASIFIDSLTGNIGINTTDPSYKLDVSGTGRITTSLTTGALYSTNQTTTNIVTTAISAGTVVSTTTSTANIYSSLGTISNLVGTSLSSSNLTATGATITNLSVPGTLTVVNITSTNLVETNITAVTLQATTGITSASLLVTGLVSAANLTSTTGTIPNVVFTNASSSNMYTTILTSGNIYITNTTVAYGFSSAASIISAGGAAFRNMWLAGAAGSSTGNIPNQYTPLVLGWNSGNPQISFQRGDGAAATVYLGVNTQAQFAMINNSGVSSGGLLFQTSSARPIYFTGGNVGIGTSNPSYALDVIGTGNITTSLTTGALFSTNQTTTNIVATSISSGNVIANNNLNISGISSFFGGSFSANNNVGSASTVTGLLFPSATVRSFIATLNINISKPSGNLNSTVTLEGTQLDSGWILYDSSLGDSTGLVFTIDSSGQILYTSPNYIGWVSTTIRFEAHYYTLAGTYTPVTLPTSGNVSVTGVLSVNNTSNATSTSSGALTVSGGAGISKSLLVGENLNVGGLSNTFTGSFAAANNVAAATSVTGLLVPTATFSSFTANVNVRLLTTLTTLNAQYIFEATQSTGGWLLNDTSFGDAVGIAFTITSAGQIQYTSTNVANWQSTTINFAVNAISISSGFTAVLPTSGSVAISGNLTIDDTTDSSSTSSASLVLAGGVGINKSLLLGGNFNIGGVSTQFAGTFSAANGASGVSIPALLFPNANIRSFSCTISLRVVSSVNYNTQHTIEGIQRATGGWQISDSQIGDASGITFAINSSGQLTYTSPTFTSWTSTTMHYNAVAYNISSSYTPMPMPTAGSATIAGPVVIQSTDLASSTSSGALSVSGGVSIQNNLIVANNFFVTSAGNVGIGTSAPAQTLTISNDNAPFLRFDRSGVVRFDFEVGMEGTADLLFRGGANATGGSLTEFMRINGNSGNVGIGTSSPNARFTVSSNSAQIALYPLTNGSEGSIAFYNNTIASGNTTRWVIGNNAASGVGNFGFWNSSLGRAALMMTSTGNIGINTTAPAARLDVSGGGDSDGTGVESMISLQYRTSSSGGFRHFIISRHNAVSSLNAGNAIDFYLNTSNTAAGSSVPGTGNALGMTIAANGISIRTTTPTSALTVNNIVYDRSSFDHSVSPLTVTQNASSGSSVLNDQIPVMHLCRQGLSGQSYGQRATFALSRYENSSTNSRTRLDIQLSQNAYDTENVMSIRGDGNVGIGTTAPTQKLHVVGDIFIANRNTSLLIQPGLQQTTTTASVTQYDIPGTGLHYFWDNLQATGTITGSSKNFCIKHPLDDSKALVHAAIEAPKYDLIYSGRALLHAGQAIINIDTDSCPEHPMDSGTFEALTRNPRVYLQNNESFDRVKASLNGNLLTIICENSTSTDTIDWMIIAERRDSDIINTKYSDNNGYLITQHNREDILLDESNRPSYINS